MNWLHHWVWDDFGVPVWPNVAAAAVMSTWIIRRVKKHLESHHKKIAELVARNGPTAKP
jgi:hypothetical protein